MATYPLSEAYVDGDVLTAANVNSITEGVNDLAFGVFNDRTASYTIAITDVAKVVTMNMASSNNLTVPANGTTAFPIGSQILIYQKGAGQTTIVAASGVTIRSEASKLKITGQYGVAGLLKLGTDEWVAFGNLSS